MQDATSHMQSVRMRMSTMVCMKPSTFMCAKCAVCEQDSLFLREDRPDVSKPQPLLERDTGQYKAMYSSYYLAVADV